MKKLNKEGFFIKDPSGNAAHNLKFDVDIYVNNDGKFSTTLNSDLAEKFKSLGMSLHNNRVGNAGYFSDNTKSGLIKQIFDFASEALSRKIIERKVMLRYVIAFQCSYAFTKHDEIVPNCSYEFGGLNWKEGNIRSDSQSPTPYGIQVYVKPCICIKYQYLSGRTTTEYSRLNPNGDEQYNLQNNPNLFWLNGLTSITIPIYSGLSANPSVKYMEYTEERALFFVNLIKSICRMNENFKDLFNEDNLESFIESQKGQNLILQ